MALPLMQTRLDEKEAAESRATKSESEVSELSKRLVEIKMGEADRINKARALFCNSTGPCLLLLYCFQAPGLTASPQVVRTPICFHPVNSKTLIAQSTLVKVLIKNGFCIWASSTGLLWLQSVAAVIYEPFPGLVVVR